MWMGGGRWLSTRVPVARMRDPHGAPGVGLVQLAGVDQQMEESLFSHHLLGAITLAFK